eukprot:scaffold18518_cov48-Phaeocystis_antarctica.AAC.1
MYGATPDHDRQTSVPVLARPCEEAFKERLCCFVVAQVSGLVCVFPTPVGAVLFEFHLSNYHGTR